MKLPIFSPGPINAYTDDGARAKEEFLRTARRFLRAVGRELAEGYGWTEVSVRPNRGGIACSGEVYGEFRHPQENVGVLLEVGGFGMAWGGAPPRPDGLSIRAVWRCRSRERAHTPEGPNRWLDPNADSTQIASEAYSIYRSGVASIGEAVESRRQVA